MTDESNKVSPDTGASDKDVSFIFNLQKTYFLFLIIEREIYS